MKHSYPKSTSGSTPHCRGLLHSTPSTQLQALNTTSGSTPHCRGLLHPTPSTQLQALNTTSGSTPHCRGLLHSISKHSTASSQQALKREYTPLQGSSPLNSQLQALNSKLSTQQAGVHPSITFYPERLFSRQNQNREFSSLGIHSWNSNILFSRSFGT